MTLSDRVLQLSEDLVRIGRKEEGRYFWHTAQDRYVVFLAEFFLRRSNRSTVARFLPQFLSAYPNMESLGRAEPESVAAAARWAGLTTRMMRLPEISRALSSKRSWTAEELLELPHIGNYAAEGIALYAFDEPHFPVDNNVRRVVGRFLSVDVEDAFGPAITALTEAVLANGGVGCLKHAHRGALALGWQTCKTKRTCGVCPLSGTCAGSAERTVTFVAA